ncbi:MAG: type VI secretion system protein TssA [Aridibacter sp.]
MSDVLEKTEEQVEQQTQKQIVEAEQTVEPSAEVSEQTSGIIPEVLEESEESAHELSKPPVIDLKSLLKPISGENPSGESVRYSGVYDEITEARRADEDLAQGEWQVELKIADYKKVIEAAIPVLETETKDLQIAAWLSESLVRENGFAGLRDSLKLLSGLQRKFWDTLFPEIDEGNMEGRANALAWVDEEAAFSIKKAPITNGEGYSFFDYEDSKKFNIPANLESLAVEEQEKFKKLEEQARKENRTTAAQWEKSLSASKRAFYEELNIAIEECWTAHNALNQLIEEKFEINQAPSLGNLKKTLENIQLQTDKILQQKREEEPDPVEESEVSEEAEEAESETSSNKGKSSIGGTINNRREALKELEKIASFFRQTEPHSPVSYLVNRAVKWGNMPLDSWLQDVVKDGTVLGQLREILGFNTSLEGNDGDETATYESTEGATDEN